MRYPAVSGFACMRGIQAPPPGRTLSPRNAQECGFAAPPASQLAPACRRAAQRWFCPLLHKHTSGTSKPSSTMPPSKQDFAVKRGGGMRNPNFRLRSSMGSGFGKRGSAVLPSVLTFAVIVASGGLLLMIEKGMLNGMDPPPPRASGRTADHRPQAGQYDAAGDTDAQVTGRYT